MSEKPVLTFAAANGLDTDTVLNDIFRPNRVLEDWELEPSLERPDVIVFGPYGNDLPPCGEYIRVGYYCENMAPNFDICEYALGVAREAQFQSKAYKRIQWHGFDPVLLVKAKGFEKEITHSHDRFCNFLYSHRVPYREEFFERLCKYKNVDAPGKSMNNHVPIDSGRENADVRWETKRKFLGRYKFTLAFENDLFPGYQTEKLYDAMRANSLPVYVGDPDVGAIFDTRSLITLSGGDGPSHWVRKIENFAQMRFSEMVGAHVMRLDTRVARKSRAILRDIKMKLLLAKYAASLVDEIVELDRDEDAYRRRFTFPWLKYNAVLPESYSNLFWGGIFRHAIERRSIRGN